jgi:hypothetical protein
VKGDTITVTRRSGLVITLALRADGKSMSIEHTLCDGLPVTGTLVRAN